MPLQSGGDIPIDITMDDHQCVDTNNKLQWGGHCTSFF